MLFKQDRVVQNVDLKDILYEVRSLNVDHLVHVLADFSLIKMATLEDVENDEKLHERKQLLHGSLVEEFETVVVGANLLGLNGDVSEVFAENLQILLLDGYHVEGNEVIKTYLVIFITLLDDVSQELVYGV